MFKASDCQLVTTSKLPRMSEEKMEASLQAASLEDSSEKIGSPEPASDSNDRMETLSPNEIPNIINEESVLGPEWCAIFETDVDFKIHHYVNAMTNLIRNPNINSTVILRADILKEIKYIYGDSEEPEQHTYINENPEELLSTETVLTKNLSDMEIHTCPHSDDFKPSLQTVRRIIPRNPSKDCVINQTCLVLNNSKENSTLVVYIPHIDNPEDVPFYLPAVRAIGILLRNGKLSVHYAPYEQFQSVQDLQRLAPTERVIRIAYRLLNTAKKHSTGVMNGYQKRVTHDLVVSKVSFQDRYITLKQKYAKSLVDSWCESTDPRKHVFEDIAIAAFLIEFWDRTYPSKDSFEFRDLGCGNGLLVHILTMEGYKGIGIDARSRKSWALYPPTVQSRLKEQVIIPSVLLRPHPAVRLASPHIKDNGKTFMVPVNPKETKEDGKVISVRIHSSEELLKSPSVNSTEFPPNTFIIGNHSDELTCWIPLLGYPFLVIPCCSHSLSGDKIRYTPNKRKQAQNTVTSYSSSSRYAALVDHVEEVANLAGWQVEREMLRIPSTRNAAIVGYRQDLSIAKSIYDIIAMEGGADKWVENTMALMKKPQRDH